MPMKKISREQAEINFKKRFIGDKKDQYKANTVQFLSLRNKDENLRESPDGSETKTLTLKIMTESESPAYEDWWSDCKYVEEFSRDAFDESLAEVNTGKRIVYSYADHQMDMKNIISSTNRKGTKLYKDKDGNIIMEMELYPDTNSLHRIIVETVENGEAPANSFIFIPQDYEIKLYEEGERDDGVEYKVIQKKGILLSIDPVISAFYPQNKVELKQQVGEQMTAEEKAKADAAAKAKAEADKKAAEEAEAKALKETEEAEAKAAKEAEEAKKAKEAEEKAAEEAKKAEEEAKAKEAKEAEEKAAKEAKKAEEEAKKAEEKAAKDAEEQAKKDAKKTETEAAKAAKAAEKAQKLADEEFEKKLDKMEEEGQIIDLMDKAKSVKQRNASVKKLQSLRQVQRDARRAEILKLKGSDKMDKILLKEEHRTLAYRTMVQCGSHRDSDALNLEIKGVTEKGEQLVWRAVAEQNESTIKKLKITEDELNIFGLTRDNLTGNNDQSTQQTGYSIVPISTQNSVLGEDAIAFPETDGAVRISAKGLEKTQIPISISAGGMATVLAEGVAATTISSSVVRCMLELERFAENFEYNPILNAHAPLLQQKTTELFNRTTRGIKDKFYKNLLKHAGDTFASLKDTYEGGVTSDSVIESETSGAITLDDLDAMIMNEQLKTGEIKKSSYVFMMQPSTYRAIIKKAKEDKQPNAKFWVVDGDVTVQGYDGIRVIVDERYTDGVAAGKHAVVLKKKKSTIIYGGLTILKDSKEVLFTKDMLVRQKTTRVQMKHVDPFYHVTTLKIKA